MLKWYILAFTANEQKKPTDQRSLVVGDSIYKSYFREDDSAGVFEAQLGGKDVVVKRAAGVDAQREVSVLSHADSSGIPKVIQHQCGENGGLDTIVMERLKGVGLNTFIQMDGEWRSKPQPLGTAVSITSQLARRFRSLSRAGYVYRDLNLSHIMVDGKPGDELKVGLLDFEACVKKGADGSAVVDSERGTWETMAPEEFTVGNRVSDATAVYALGTILIQLVSGSCPFRVGKEVPVNMQRDFARFLHERGVPYLPFEGTPMHDVLNRSLAPNPRDRYQSITEFKEAVEALN